MSFNRAVLFFFAAAMLLPAAGALAADHLDAPGLTSPGDDGRLDIPDVYAFQSPSDPNNTVLIMTLNPAAGALSPVTLHPNARYSFRIDNDGDAKEEVLFELRVGDPNPATGAQELTLWCKGSRDCPKHDPLASGLTGAVIPLETGGRVQVGVFDDPFFFDLSAFLGEYDFCSAPGGQPGESGADFFAGLNVTAIVIEIPSSVLGGLQIGVWSTTQLKNKQIDRMGRPAINTVFIPSEFKNKFNRSHPRQDAQRFGRFLGDLAPVLLPDILTVDTSSAAGFLNGRKPTDDVIDIELQVITGDPAAGDCVDANDAEFSNDFPYLAPAH